MKKILSIVIPTYNMEEYLPRCLDSLVNAKYLDNIEIIVVNDGSKDRSSEIAHSYESKYTGSIIVIDKANGNYGSTINAALPLVTGKYVKILDSDDWFDTANLDIFISQLLQIDADMIFTNTAIWLSNNKVDRSTINYTDKLIKETNDLSVFYDGDLKDRSIQMHSVTYRSSILINNRYIQTEGVSYTDMEWVYYPLQFVKSVKFLSLDLYQYFMGREGQTMDPEVYHKMKYIVVLLINKMILNYREFDNKLCTGGAVMNMILFRHLRELYSKSLIQCKSSEKFMKAIMEVDRNLIEYDNLYTFSGQLVITTPKIPIYRVEKWRNNKYEIPLWVSSLYCIYDLLRKIKHTIDV